MLYTSRGLSFILSLGISIASVFFLFLFERPAANTLLVVWVITISVSFALIFFLLESQVFREIKKIKESMQPSEDDTLPFANEKRENNDLRDLVKEVAALTQAKQSEIEKLRRQEAFRKDFIADISHELKTPIFAAQGFVLTLLDGAVNEKAVRKKFLKKAAKSLHGLDMLVQDLLTLSLIETGKITMNFEYVDLFSLTEEVFDQLTKKADKKEITLRLKGPVRKVIVYADGQRITQVMTNLISNAIKHSSPGGSIEVSFSVKKKSVVTRVKDSGEGIAEEHINRIFERFYRVDKSRSREKGGTGLGLAIVKHILEGHNSKPKVESTPGKGSTFSFSLPRTLSEETTNGTEDVNNVE